MIKDLLRWTADNYEKVDCAIAGAALGCMFEKKFINDNNEIEPKCENNEGWDFQRRLTKETVEMKTTWGKTSGNDLRINLTNKVWMNMKGQTFTSFDYLLVYENVNQKYFIISKEQIKNFECDISITKSGGQKVELRWSSSYGQNDKVRIQNTLAILDCEVTNKKYKDWYK
jgi:hypothetical protein